MLDKRAPNPFEADDLPPGALEAATDYAVRTAIRDLTRIYGRRRAKEIATEIVEDETEHRK